MMCRQIPSHGRYAGLRRGAMFHTKGHTSILVLAVSRRFIIFIWRQDRKRTEARWAPATNTRRDVRGAGWLEGPDHVPGHPA